VLKCLGNRLKSESEIDELDDAIGHDLATHCSVI
jgi:hypothetical protein